MKKPYILNEQKLDRQQIITNVFCKRNTEGRLNFPNKPELNNKLWSEYAKTYKVSPTEIEVATRTCPKPLPSQKDLQTQKNTQQKMYQQRAQQINKQTQDLTKKIQQSIGVQSPNGQLDLNTINKLIELLK